jgi:uncharacterized membrane protein
MAKNDIGDAIGTAIGKVARETAQTVAANAKKGSNGPLSGMRGVAAGAGLVALAPIVTKGAGRLVKRGIRSGAQPVKKAGGKLMEEAGGAAGMAKHMLPGSDGSESNGVAGVGKGRRMPIQQAIDVAVPVKTAYNQWTQFEDWPRFMHRLERVVQRDPSHVAFKTKIWGVSKEFEAEIVEQRPDERIKWRVTDGLTHAGVVTFHELSERLTRIEVNLDVQPDSLIEKAARGMRHVKRAVRADLSRFKAYVEMEEHETGAWRGVIDDGKLKSSQRTRSSSKNGSRRSAKSKPKSSSGGRTRTASTAKTTSSRSRGGSSTRKSSSSRRSSSSGSKSSSSRS